MQVLIDAATRLVAAVGSEQTITALFTLASTLICYRRAPPLAQAATPVPKGRVRDEEPVPTEVGVSVVGQTANVDRDSVGERRLIEPWMVRAPGRPQAGQSRRTSSSWPICRPAACGCPNSAASLTCRFVRGWDGHDPVGGVATGLYGTWRLSVLPSAASIGPTGQVPPPASDTPGRRWVQRRSEFGGYLISVDVSSPQVVTARLAALLQLVMEALQAGVSVSSEIHARQGWNPDADRHTEHGLVRREAMERLKPFGASLEDGDNLGLPMSGLILRSAAGDVLRVWHSEDGELPPAATGPLRRFFHQQPTRQGTLFLADPTDSTVADSRRAGDGGWREPVEPSNLAMLWDDDGRDLIRFDLVRPFGVAGQRALIDWQVNLLGRMTHAEDLDFGDDGSGSKGELG